MSNIIRDLVSEIQFVHKKDKWTIADVAKSIGKTRDTLQRAMKNPEEDASKAIKALLIEKHGGVIQNVSRGTALHNPLPLGDLVVTLGDYFDLLKSQRDSYEKIIQSGLIKLQNDVNQSSVDSHGRASAILEEIRSWNTVILKAVKERLLVGTPKQSGRSEEKPSRKRMKPDNHKDGNM